RCAQEKTRRKSLVGTTQHAAGIVGLDQAFDRDGKIGDRRLSKHMGDIAERVLMYLQPRIRGDIDLPFGDILPIMAAGRHPQDLDDSGRRRFVAIGGGMGDAQAHEVPGGARVRESSLRGAKRRSNPSGGKVSMDCFAALAMTVFGCAYTRSIKSNTAG